MNSVAARRSTLLIGALLYATALALVYERVIARDYGYAGYSDVGPAISQLGAAVLLAALPVLWLPLVIRGPGSVAFWFLFGLAYVPGQVIPPFVVDDPGRLRWWALSLLIGVSLAGALAGTRTRVRLEASLSSLLWVSVAALSLLAYVSAWSTGAVTFSVTDPVDVYTTRFKYRQVTSYAGSILAYSVAWAGNVLNPLLMAAGLVRRSWGLVAASLLGQLMLFRLTGFKSFLYAPLLAWAITFGIRRGLLRRLSEWVLWGAFGITVAGALFHAAGSRFVTYVFTRRVLATPGLLDGVYLDFFSTNPHTLWSDSFLSNIVPARYSVSTPFVVGAKYFRDPQMSANANLFADGFAGGGWAGVVLMGVLLGLVLLAWNTVAAGRDWRYMAGVAGVLGFEMANTALSTAMLTQGVALAIILTLMLPAEPVGAPLGASAGLDSAPDHEPSRFREALRQSSALGPPRRSAAGGED